MPPWKHRRRLIYGTCFLAAGMIIFAAATFRSDTNVAGQLILGGVSLLSITLTAYTAFATIEDTKLWKITDQIQETINPQEDEVDEQNYGS